MDVIVGKCMQKCSQEEMKWRQRERLIHLLEADEATVDGPAGRRRADPDRMVKCFQRSAAGRRLCDRRTLRPPPVLLRTTDYLFTSVLPRPDVGWPAVYGFCLDRLRAVRQDLTVQQARGPAALAVLRRCVVFHLYADYRSRDYPADVFDRHINTRQLHECLLGVLQLQKAALTRGVPDRDGWLSRDVRGGDGRLSRDIPDGDGQLSRDVPDRDGRLSRDVPDRDSQLSRDVPDKDGQRSRDVPDRDGRPCRDVPDRDGRLCRDVPDRDGRLSELFEAVHLLVSLEGGDAGMCEPWTRPQTRDLKLAVDFRRAWESGNFVRAFRLARQMSPLLQLAVYRHIAGLRRRALRVLAAAYHSAALSVPAAAIAGWLDYDDVTGLRSDITGCGRLTAGGDVCFDRKPNAVEVSVPDRVWPPLDRAFRDPVLLLTVCQITD